jgi:signal transduction histidine kinase
MAQRIDDLITAHQDLTHAVSHELKTPLSRFKFSLEIINNSNDSEQRNKYLHAMKQDVRELDMLIDEMLSYAKLGAHNLKLNRQSVNAEHWLKEIIQHYDTEKIAINLHCAIHLSDEEKQIMIDKHLMSRAVHNLIRNGLRYAHKQLQISFIRESKQISLSIEDDGEGIPRQFWEQVFQPFTRLDTSRDKQSGGYGLGLAITQKIVHQHGGRIQIDKSALGGVCFKINWTI